MSRLAQKDKRKSFYCVKTIKKYINNCVDRERGAGAPVARVKYYIYEKNNQPNCARRRDR